MSIDATTWAWKVRGLKSTDKLVLLALADRAGEDHTAWPSIERLVQDTELNRKTVQAAIARLIDNGYVADTGRKTGASARVRVLRLVGVVGREEQPQKRDYPKNGTIPKVGQSQKRDDTNNGTIPNLDGDDPKNGLGDDPKNGIQNLPIEPTKEPLTECAPPSAAPAVIALPLNGKDQEHLVTGAELTQWQELYPGVDVMAALREIRAWALANPNRRKTRQGIAEHIRRWLSKAQDKGQYPAGANQRARPAANDFRWTTTTRLTENNTNGEVGQALRQGCPWHQVPQKHQEVLLARFVSGQLSDDLKAILERLGVAA